VNELSLCCKFVLVHIVSSVDCLCG
jgi:hypothetical protein